MSAESWQDALDRYAAIDADTARTNVAILTALRERWSEHVDVTASMFRLVFTRHDVRWPDADTWAEAEQRADDVVALALRRRTERGPVTVTGDAVRTATAVAAVEALLYQL